MAQFTMTAYYILGGAYSMQMGDHVRMDLTYDRYSEKTKAKIDGWTNIFLLFYLVTLLIGSISSTMYAIEYDQLKFSQWNPSMIPIKVIMVFGIFLMLLQELFKLSMGSSHYYHQVWYWGGEAKLCVEGNKMELTTIPQNEWDQVEKDSEEFWDEMAAVSPRAKKVVEIFKEYSKVMDKAGIPYRYS